MFRNRLMLALALALPAELLTTTFIHAYEKHEEHDHEHEEHDSAVTATTAEINQAAEELRFAANDLCWGLWNTYNDQSEAFYDAYREAYEIMQQTKSVKQALLLNSSSASVSGYLKQISSEIHHIENHLPEFSERTNVSTRAKDEVNRRFERTEKALHEVMELLKIKDDHEGDHDHDHDHAAQLKFKDEINWDEANRGASELEEKSNALKTALEGMFKVAPDKFADTFQQSFTLYMDAHKIKGLVDAQQPVEALTTVSSSVNTLTHEIGDKLSSSENNDAVQKADLESLKEKFEETEGAMHSFISVMFKSEATSDSTELKKQAEALSKEFSSQDLANQLAIAANSFCRAIDHNYKTNPDFKEAHNESTEFKNVCLELCTLLNGDQISDEGRAKISGLDGELHHLSEHVNGFRTDDVSDKNEVGRARRKLSEIQLNLHALMLRAGIERKHVN
ncbi:hypothetical protein SH668x_001740 [Planctomicrobium sp. SH668]|uniref:hypothetical protein n=1 Tax=Planctomicrobium sp. SH668 TaxID=3448126 RepID=UPI003F5BB00D